MIYLIFECDIFNYEIEDVLKLFFKENEIVYCQAEPPVESRGIFMFSRMDNFETGRIFELEIKGGLEAQIKIAFPVNKDEEQSRLEWKKQKKELKRQLFLLLSKHTGVKPPWGTLTGIRPTKLIHEMLDENIPQKDILSKLTGYHMLSGDKAELVCRVAEVERRVLKGSEPASISLYIGIPFCNTRCLYCSFPSNPIAKYKRYVKEYLKALEIEIHGTRKILERRGLTVQSIYIGGGTPTSIESEDLEKLLKLIEQEFDIENVEEYTLEAGRPDSIDRDKLKTIKSSRVSRISINPQTMNNETLKLIGRSHSTEETIEAFRLARHIGFDNINTDVIVGLPGENLEMFRNTMEGIRKLKPESLTVHTMAIKRAASLNRGIHSYSLANPEEAAEMVEMGKKYALEMGMHPYYMYRQKNILGNLENTGYCKPGYESIYNIQIMEERQTIVALGVGAVSKVVYPEENRIERAFNVKTVEEYFGRVDEMVERKRALL